MQELAVIGDQQYLSAIYLPHFDQLSAIIFFAEKFQRGTFNGEIFNIMYIQTNCKDENRKCTYCYKKHKMAQKCYSGKEKIDRRLNFGF